MKKRLDKQAKAEIARRYEALERMVDLAKEFGVTRSAIWHVLKAQGIDTSKRRLPVFCALCGSEV